MPSPRVLIVAENVSARFGGEAFLPLHYFRVLRARGVPVWLLTHQRVRKELEELFPDAGDAMLFVPDTKMQVFLHKAGMKLPSRIKSFTTNFLVQIISERMQRKIARGIVAKEKITVVHQPTPVSPRLPSGMYKVNAPVLIGPMNGGMTYPPAFSHMASKLENAILWVLSGTVSIAQRIFPGKRRAALLLVSNQRTRDALPPILRDVPVKELVENGVDQSRFKVQPREAADPSRMTFAFVGRLINLKAVDIIFEALAGLESPVEVRLELFGDGEDRQTLEALALELGLQDRVVFHGFMAQKEVAIRLGQLDGLVLASLHECGGAVVLEAMAMGLPVIATNWGGPADYLDPSCGILLDPTSRESLVQEFRASMKLLAENPDKRAEMGKAGRAKVDAEFDWEAKVDAMVEIYRSLESGQPASSQE
ncbi:MAG: glycosyltransferase family 4 protein [Planctomycetes bacterium]|nr:glycosyltransferase family 4 protein [Planctomycetota bacterium]MCP4771022.1 glycosyltransferase family 4 protein [Planctomycetota bacterium]MCP4861741.1 glycosyltransferase family 4 protein [Planctomycetota bacterium]